MASLVRSESFSSNPESSAPSLRSESLYSNLETAATSLRAETETILAEQDFRFDLKKYADELLERGLKEERFRIDRKKLEDMLQVQQNSNDPVENAEVFFQRVMMETSTLVTWPSKLKIGGKSKKDPHVKIVGKPEAVQKAKEKILEVLDTKKNRVTLKMDVSHSDHSYIIGKGGFKIQQVMVETGCHIHFPDSNKPKPRVGFPSFKSSIADLNKNGTEKSNQVSIAGQAAGVEIARAKIRDLLPFVYVFELPNGDIVNPGEETTPAIQHIQQTYSFNVAFRLTPIGRTAVVVRGCQRLLSRLRQGLSLLMEYLTGSKTVPIMGFMKTEIAAQHHQFVTGNFNANIKQIMNKTGATIIFPDLSTFSTDSLTHTYIVFRGHSVLRTKSTVIIQGSFDSVCLAWKELLECLPLVLMFDLKEKTELDPAMVNNFMEIYNINITVKPKIKESSKTVLISGAERDCNVFFYVRKEILGVAKDSAVSSPTRPRHLENSSSDAVSEDSSISKLAQNLSIAESINMLSAIIQKNPQFVGLLNNLCAVLPTINSADVLPNAALPNSTYQAAVQNNDQISMDQYAAKREVENWINKHNRSFDLPILTRTVIDEDERSADSGIYVQRRNRFQRLLESQPESSASSTSSNDTPDYKMTSFFKKMAISNEPAVGTDIHHLLADYGNKKLSANKAMQQPIGDGVRTPTQLWSGYGFSKSMPDYAARMKKTSRYSGSITEYLDTDDSKSGAACAATWSPDPIEKKNSPPEALSPFSFSNYWENVPQQPSIDYGAIEDVEQLLYILDLQKYNEVFSHHEIDFITLLTLTDLDLQQLGISYGARLKLLAAIAAIRTRRLGDCAKNFTVAPGAERKNFLSYSTGPSVSNDSNAII